MAGRMEIKNGLGGMLAFDVGKDLKDARKYTHELKVMYHAVSLDAIETLILCFAQDDKLAFHSISKGEKLAS